MLPFMRGEVRCHYEEKKIRAAQWWSLNSQLFDNNCSEGKLRNERYYCATHKQTMLICQLPIELEPGYRKLGNFPDQD